MHNLSHLFKTESYFVSNDKQQKHNHSEEEYIKKCAKRLHKTLLEIPEVSNMDNSDRIFSLMKCQNIISQSLGFDNFYHVQENNKQYQASYLEQNKIYLQKQKNTDDLQQYLGYSLEHKKFVIGRSRHTLYVSNEQPLADKMYFEQIKECIKQNKPVIYFNTQGNEQHCEDIAEFAKQFGRGKDILLLNYTQQLKKPYLFNLNHKTSHTQNPFESASAGGLTELFVSFIDSESEMNMWKGRAISLMSSLLMALVYMRDKQGLKLNAGVIREYLFLNNIIKLYKNSEHFPQHIQTGLKSYLLSLPGFKMDVDKQSEIVEEQHGYLQMQYSKILSTLSEDYGYIFNSSSGEVDYYDVLYNKKILIILLPDLSKSAEEIHKLYQLQINLLAFFCSQSLGLNIEMNDSMESVEAKKRGMNGQIFIEQGLSFIAERMATLSTQLKALSMSIHCLINKIPVFDNDIKNTAIQSFVANFDYHLYFKGNHPSLSLKNQSAATKLNHDSFIFQHEDIELFLKYK